MSWGAAVAWQAAPSRAERAVRFATAALAAAAFGAGMHTALTAPAEVPPPAAYMSGVWPQGGMAWTALTAALGRQLVLGAAGAWLAGLTVVGAPLALGVVALRAYLAGVAVLSALAHWGTSGWLVVLLSLAPSHLLGLHAAIHGAAGAVRWALAFGKAVAGSASVDLPLAFRLYARTGLGVLLLCGAAAGAEVAGVLAARVLLALAPWGV